MGLGRKIAGQQDGPASVSVCAAQSRRKTLPGNRLCLHLVPAQQPGVAAEVWELQHRVAALTARCQGRWPQGCSGRPCVFFCTCSLRLTKLLPGMGKSSPSFRKAIRCSAVAGSPMQPVRRARCLDEDHAPQANQMTIMPLVAARWLVCGQPLASESQGASNQERRAFFRDGTAIGSGEVRPPYKAKLNCGKSNATHEQLA